MKKEVRLPLKRFPADYGITIKMFSGRTHRAKISVVHRETRTVSVIWSEEGELRGKNVKTLPVCLICLVQLFVWVCSMKVSYIAHDLPQPDQIFLSPFESE